MIFIFSILNFLNFQNFLKVVRADEALRRELGRGKSELKLNLQLILNFLMNLNVEINFEQEDLCAEILMVFL